MRRLIVALTLALALGVPTAWASDPPTDVAALQQQIAALRAELATALAARPETPTIAESAAVEAALAAIETRLEALEEKLAALAPQDPDQAVEDAQRLDAVERKAALDRVNLTGEIRVATDLLQGTQAAYMDGLMLQKGIVDSMFFLQTNQGAFPMPADPNDPLSIYRTLAGNVDAHYADYLRYTSRLTFADLKAAMGSFPAPMQQALMGLLAPATFTPAQDYENNLFYTTRLRLNLRSDIAEHLSFAGRLAMYKAWGDSAGVQVFNGQPNSINVDGTTTGVPNSDIVRVERAYFDWSSIGGSGLYLSLGRRPSTSGPPTEIREGKLRGGTPLGHVVDYQFDGVTVGYNLTDKMPGAIWRFCYGLGYESGFGSADQLRSPADRLKDAHFGGFNLDLYSTDRMFVQGTVLRAMDVTDGFNALVVMPIDPLTGNPAPGPAVMRFTPSANLGDIDLAGLLVERHDGPLSYFASMAGMWTHPDDVTTVFGGLLSDPFESPVDRSAWSVYAGARYDFPNGATQIGAEFNHGSQYWFNFTANADEILLSKLSTRGNVYEVYLNHDFATAATLRISGLTYDYEYSGSGWHMGAPKPIDQTPMLGFPTYRDMFNLRVAMSVRF
ncbi:MAG: DUF3373 family protein [Vicinamibacterales bacterium]